MLEGLGKSSFDQISPGGMKEAFIFTEESSISPSADNPERMAWNNGQNGDSGQGRWRMDRWKRSAKDGHGRKVKAYK